MKRIIPIGIALALSGWGQKAQGPQEDKYETLIRRLLKRVSDSDLQITKIENQCLEGQNVILQGRHISHPLNSAPSLDRLVTEAHDAEDFIEEHNRRYPDSPWAEVK
jgi:hypothetical protein